MRRRALLAACASGLAVASTGCLAEGDGPGGGPGDGTTPTDGPSGTTTDGTTTASDGGTGTTHGDGVTTTADRGATTSAPWTTGDPPTTAGEWTIDVREGRCGTGHGARVVFDGAVVTVDGALQTPNPCHGAAVGAVERDGGTLTLRIEPTEPNQLACIECVGVVEYRWRLATGDDPPGTVVVRHGSGEDARTVTTATL